MGIGGVGAAHGARPQPGDNGQLLAEQGFEVGAGGAHLGGDGDCRVEVADAFCRFVAHPVAIAAHALGEAARARPVLRHAALLFAGGQRADGADAGKARRDVEHGFVDHYRNGVEVAGVSGKAEALRFQRQRATTGKGVMECGQDVGVEEGGGLRVFFVECAGFAPAFPDSIVGALEDVGVVAVFPLHQVADDVEEFFPPVFGFFFVDAAPEAFADFVARIVHHLREDHGAGGGQRPPRPPQVQGAGVAVADGFFARGSAVDVIQRQGDFNQFFRDVDGVHGADPGGRAAIVALCTGGAMAALGREANVFCCFVHSALYSRIRSRARLRRAEARPTADYFGFWYHRVSAGGTDWSSSSARS